MTTLTVSLPPRSPPPPSDRLRPLPLLLLFLLPLSERHPLSSAQQLLFFSSCTSSAPCAPGPSPTLDQSSTRLPEPLFGPDLTRPKTVPDHPHLIRRWVGVVRNCRRARFGIGPGQNERQDPTTDEGIGEGAGTGPGAPAGALLHVLGRDVDVDLARDADTDWCVQVDVCLTRIDCDDERVSNPTIDAFQMVLPPTKRWEDCNLAAVG
jgi:hypothetical protein